MQTVLINDIEYTTDADAVMTNRASDYETHYLYEWSAAGTRVSDGQKGTILWRFSEHPEDGGDHDWDEADEFVEGE